MIANPLSIGKITTWVNVGFSVLAHSDQLSERIVKRILLFAGLIITAVYTLYGIGQTINVIGSSNAGSTYGMTSIAATIV